MKKKLVFFGFSVTRHGNPTTYVDELRKIIGDHYDIASYALGGVSFDALPYLVTTICQNKPDILVLEVGTSAYVKGNVKIEDAEFVLLNTLQAISKQCVGRVIFMMLPRLDLPKPCLIMEALLKYQSQWSYDILDLQTSFADNWNDYSHDTVHPSKLGVEYIVSKFTDFFCNTEKNPNFGTKISFDSRAEFIPVINHANLHNFPLLTRFQTSGFDFSFPSLLTGCSIEIKVPYESIFMGIFFLMGPDTSSFTLQSGSFLTKIKTFDENSYYYRVGFRPFYTPQHFSQGQIINIVSSDDRFGVTLSKESRFSFLGIRNYPIGFCILKSTK